MYAHEIIATLNDLLNGMSKMVPYWLLGHLPARASTHTVGVGPAGECLNTVGGGVGVGWGVGHVFKPREEPIDRCQRVCSYLVRSAGRVKGCGYRTGQVSLLNNQ